MIQAPIQMVDWKVCPRAMKRGQVKRIPQDKRVGLMAFQVCCPSCGKTAAYMQEIYRFEMSESGVPVRIEKPPRCFGCGLTIAIGDGMVQAV